LIFFFRHRGGVCSLWAHKWAPGVYDLDQKVLVCSVSFLLLKKSSLWKELFFCQYYLGVVSLQTTVGWHGVPLHTHTHSWATHTCHVVTSRIVSF